MCFRYERKKKIEVAIAALQYVKNKRNKVTETNSEEQAACFAEIAKEVEEELAIGDKSVLCSNKNNNNHHHNSNNNSYSDSNSNRKDNDSSSSSVLLLVIAGGYDTRVRENVEYLQVSTVIVLLVYY